MFDVMDFYGEPVYLCTHVSVYKYVGIILYGSQYLSFTACKRMLIFLGKKKCYESCQEKLIPINRLT